MSDESNKTNDENAPQGGNSNDLLDCPFCGEEASIHERGNCVHVGCNDSPWCPGCYEKHMYPNKGHAELEWNQRESNSQR